MSVRVGWGLVRARSAGNRWRRFALPVAVMLATLSVLLVLGLSHMAGEIRARQDARGLQYVSPESSDARTAPLRIHLGFDSGFGRQWDEFWVEPLTDDAPVAPGLDRWPDPGTFVVSPALAAAIDGSPELRARYPKFVVIGDDGLSDGGEWFAYARPRAGELLPVDAALFKGFGTSHHDGGSRELTSTVVFGAMLFVGIPALLLLAAGLAVASPTRERRRVVLHWIGAPRAVSGRIAAAESVLAAAPGVLLALLLWVLVAPRLRSIPVVDVHPLSEDLSLSPLLVVGVGLAVLVAIGTSSFLLGRRRTRVSGPRPVASARVSRLGLIPLVAAALIIGWGVYAPQARSSKYPALIATLLLLVGVPASLPYLARLAGRAMADGKSVAALLAGRRVATDPGGAIRPLLGVGAFVFMTLTVVGFVVATKSNDPPRPRDPSLDFAEILYFSPSAGDLDAVSNRLDGMMVAAFDQSQMSLAVTCEEASRAGGENACGPDGQLTLAWRDRVGTFLNLPPNIRPLVHLVPPASPEGQSARAIVIGEHRDDFAKRVRVAAAAELLAPEVATSETFEPRPSPLWSWIEGGLAFAALLLVVGLFLALIDRLIRTAAHHRPLILVGATNRHLRQLELAQFGLLYGLVVGVTFVMGVANAWLMIQTAPTAAIPAASLAWIGGLALTPGIVGAFVVVATSRNAVSNLRPRE